MGSTQGHMAMSTGCRVFPASLRGPPSFFFGPRPPESGGPGCLLAYLGGQGTAQGGGGTSMTLALLGVDGAVTTASKVPWEQRVGLRPTKFTSIRYSVQ